MPKTPACSPLKRGPSQRFPPSLLISYVESPTQQSYVIATEATSDSDVDDESEDVMDDTKREYEDVHITPKAPEITLMRTSDAETGGGGATTSPKDLAAAAGNRKFLVVSRFQSARQALADARRRSFQLGEWSLSTTFQHMRSYSTSSMRCADSQNTAESSDAPVSPISSNQVEERHERHERHGPAELESGQQRRNYNIVHNVSPVATSDNQQKDSEAEPQRRQQQQQKKKKKQEPRIRAVSYQSALAKYLPTTMFSRTKKNSRNPKSQVTATMEATGGGCDTTINGKKKHLCGSTAESVACDNNNGANAKRTCAKNAVIRAKRKRFPKWILRTRPPSQEQSEEENEGDNHQREHEEGDRENSLRPATRVAF